MIEQIEAKGKVSEIFAKLMTDTSNIEDVKKMVKNLTDISEKHVYHSFICN
jgi:hypothetical protein